MLQRELIFKKLQEMQQQQQVQNLGDIRQQNFQNPLPFLNKQTDVGGHHPLVEENAMQDASENFIDGNVYLTRSGGFPFIQGIPKGSICSQAQNENFGMLPVQPAVLSCGTSTPSLGSYLSWYSHLQGATHDSANMLTKRNYDQTQLPEMQSTAASNSFLSGNFNASHNKVCMFNGSLVPRNAFQQKNMFSAVPMLPSTDGVLQSNPEQAYSHQRNTLLKESGMIREQTRCPVNSTRRTQNDVPFQGTSSLDPLEEKILFNTDENSWESTTRQGTASVGCFQSTQEHLYFMGPYSSNQSGSWSALMLSAASEASSTDTGQQEEWSGLTFQNPELSSDNQPTNFVGCGNLQSSWMDNNLQNVSSPTSKPEALKNPDMGCCFPGFQQSSYQAGEQREGMESDSFHESVQHMLKYPGRDCNFSGFQQSNHHRGEELKETKWLQRSTSKSIIECGQRLSVQVQSPDIWSNLRAAEDVSARDNSDYTAAPFDTSAVFSGQNTAEASYNASYLISKENSEGARNGGHSGSGGSNPSSYVSCIEDSDNQLYHNNMSASQGLGIMLSPPSQLTSKSFSSVNSSATFISGPLYKGMPQQIRLALGPQKAAVDPTSRQYLWQSEVPLASLSSPPFPDSVHNMETSLGTINEQHKATLFHVGSDSKEMDMYTRKIQGFDSMVNLAGCFNQTDVPGHASPKLVSKQEHVAKSLSKEQAVTSASLMTALCHQVLHREKQRENCGPKTLESDIGNLNNPFQFSNGPQLEFPLVNQSLYLKNLETTPTNEVLLHSNEVDSGVEPLHVNVCSAPPFKVQSLEHPEPNSRSLLKCFQSGYRTSLCCSAEGSRDQFSQHATHASSLENQDINILSQGEIYSHSQEQHQIDTQMTRSGFKHNEKLKNVQLLPMNDLRALKEAGGQISNCQSVGTLRSGTGMQLTLKPLSPHMLSSDDSLRLTPRKRKGPALDLLPWYIEVSKSFCLLQTMSCLAESEWVLASNRLSEKMEEEAEINQGVLRVSRVKKRLGLTTQLMQQVIRPAPGPIFSADARSNGESVVFFICRLALGDACSLTNDSHLDPLASDKPLKKLRTSGSMGNQDFLKTMENFIERARRLESDLPRLDKLSSIAGIKVEIQELEKFSIITRFARFHSKGNVVPADASSDTGATRVLLKPNPQKYVVARPMPRIVPEDTKCLSV